MKNLIKTITNPDSLKHSIIAKTILYVALAVFIYTLLS